MVSNITEKPLIQQYSCLAVDSYAGLKTCSNFATFIDMDRCSYIFQVSGSCLEFSYYMSKIGPQVFKKLYCLKV